MQNCRLIRLGMLVAAVGCNDPQGDQIPAIDEVAEPASDPSTDAALVLIFSMSDGSGPTGPFPPGVFRSKEDVHLHLRLRDGETTYPDGELAFVVVDRDGAVLSSDALDCRRFLVGGNTARVLEVLPGIDTDGTPCQHGFGVHDNGRVLPQLDPYADAPVEDGVMHFTARIARVEHIVDGKFPHDAASGTFEVESPAPQPASCGDGELVEPEQCDDGNLEDGDGCSCDCTIEDHLH